MELKNVMEDGLEGLAYVGCIFQKSLALIQQWYTFPNKLICFKKLAKSLTESIGNLGVSVRA